EPQHVLRHVKLAGNLADSAECVRCLIQKAAPIRRFYAGLLLDAVTWWRHLAPSGPALMRCLRIADGLNTMTRRGEIGTSLPVFGLRPTRCPFLRTTNEPNDDNFTVWPRSKQSVISCNTSSTSEAD